MKPPSTNRGVTKNVTGKLLSFSKHLDWITVTWAGMDDPYSVLPAHPGFERVLAVPGPSRYQSAWRLKCGGLFAFSKDELQGIIVTLPGEALRNLRDEGWDDQRTVEWAARARNVTRLDYAFDVLGGTARDHSSHDAYNAYKEGNIVTRLKLDVSYKDEKVEFGGQSYYFGSKHSDQRVICYDKAAEQKLPGVNWTRVEGRFKDEYAMALVYDMVKFGVEKAGDTKLNTIWRAAIDWFEQGLTEEKVHLRDLPRTEPAWEKWLWATVLRSIENNFQKHHVVIIQFRDALNAVISDGLSDGKLG